MSNQFGKRLFNTFFKSYTEKVWGMSCKEISADWAAQRIKGLSLGSAIKNALIPQRYNGRPEQSHQDADQFFQLSAERSRNDVGSVCRKDEGAGRQIGDGLQSDALFLRRFVRPMECRIQRSATEIVQTIEAEHVISSAPMRELVCGLSPAVSERTKRAADSLKYRDFLTVMLILKDRADVR